MTWFCRNVMCEAKIKRELSDGYELIFVPYQTTMCVSADTEREARKYLNMDFAQQACELVNLVEGSRATLQRATALGDEIIEKVK